MRNRDDLRPEEKDILQRVSGLPIDYDAMAVVANIWRASQAIKLSMERSILREFDPKLTWAGFSTLFIVWVWGPIETREIAKSQGVSRATVTSNITMLESQGLVERQTSAQDRRLVIVELTPQGRELIEHVFPRFNEGEVAIASSLTLAEQHTLAHLLRKLLAGISAEEPDAG